MSDNKAQRDEKGKFAKGNDIGVATRFAPGTSGGGGLRSAGSWVKMHMNMLAVRFEKEELSFDDLEKISVDDPNPSRRMAAQQFLEASKPACDAIGKEDPGKAMQRIMDYTDGKPSQTVRMEDARETPGGSDVLSELDDALDVSS